MKTRNSTKKLTLCGILSAVGVIIMLLSGIFTTLDLTCAVLAGFSVIITVIEVGKSYPWLVYAVCGSAAILLCPNKIAPVVFLVFTGWYPIFKHYIEIYRPFVVWALKLSAFNVVFAVLVVVCDKMMLFTDLGLSLKPLVFLIGNAGFVLYDIALTSVITLYLMKLRRMMGLGNFFQD